MTKITFFGNDACPYCRKVLAKLEEKKVEFEFIQVPMDRGIRGSAIYEGKRKELSGKTFEAIFDSNISIPKMILPDGRKLMESDDMVEYLEQ